MASSPASEILGEAIDGANRAETFTRRSTITLPLPMQQIRNTLPSFYD